MHSQEVFNKLKVTSKSYVSLMLKELWAFEAVNGMKQEKKVMF